MTLFHADPAAGTVSAFGETHPASFGKGGFCPAADKREGDGRSPTGTWTIRAALLRPDRLPAPQTRLPWRWLRPWDGWSDGVDDPAYNRPVSIPHAFSHEALWREDGAYDIILVLAHNDAPPLPGLGSAIFWHCRQPDGRPTEGCIAQDRVTLARWLGRMGPGDAVRLSPDRQPRRQHLGRRRGSSDFNDAPRGALLAGTVLPLLRARDPVVPGPVGIAGSSMGGAASLKALIEWPDLLRAAGCQSTHWPILAPQPTPDAPFQAAADAARLAAGWRQGQDVTSRAFPGTGQNGAIWAARVAFAFQFLFKSPS